MFMIKILKYFVQTLLIYILFIIGRLLGINLSRKLFSFLFLKLGRFFKSTKIIEKNLDQFSTNLPKVEKEKIITNMWKNYGMTFIEYIFLDFFHKDNPLIKIDGKENLEEILIKKKPVIFVSGHFANFELMSMIITKHNIQLATIYRPLNNFFLNPFMEYLRTKYICKNQIKKGINGVREAINFIKKNHSIALMIDQRVSEGEKINFFNKPALTTTLPAQLSLKYNLNIVPVFIQRRNNTFVIEFYKNIKASDYADKINITKKLNNVIEKMITKNPSQWIWTHNRWKL